MKYFLNENTYFITTHTIDHIKYFKDDKSKDLILDIIKDKFSNFDIKIDAFSILENHYHLMFYLQEGNKLKEIMNKVNGNLAHKLNMELNRKGKLLEPYYMNNIFSENSYYKVMGYIIGNPFKHGLVDSINKLKNYKYCNYNEKAEKYGTEGINEIIGEVINLNWEKNYYDRQKV